MEQVVGINSQEKRNRLPAVMPVDNYSFLVMASFKFNKSSCMSSHLHVVIFMALNTKYMFSDRL